MIWNFIFSFSKYNIQQSYNNITTLSSILFIIICFIFLSVSISLLGLLLLCVVVVLVRVGHTRQYQGEDSHQAGEGEELDVLRQSEG